MSKVLLKAVNINHSYQHFSLVKILHKHKILENINIEINEGETVALLGISGCGKSTLARILLGLEKPASGKVFYKGEELSLKTLDERRAFYKNIQVVFQDSVSSVNPRFTLKRIIEEPMLRLTNLDEKQREQKVIELFNKMQIDLSFLNKYPSIVSGGQLQRVCIARALAVEPKLIILDEATSSLDMLIQIQILKLLKKIQKDSRTSFLVISHDLRLIKQFCSKVYVMDEGKIAEVLDIINDKIEFKSEIGKELQRAILPAMPEVLQT